MGGSSSEASIGRTAAGSSLHGTDRDYDTGWPRRSRGREGGFEDVEGIEEVEVRSALELNLISP